MSKNLASSTSSSSEEVQQQKTKPTQPGKPQPTQQGTKPITQTKPTPNKSQQTKKPSSSSSSSSSKDTQVKPQTTKTNPTQTKPPQVNAPKQNGTKKQAPKKAEESSSSSSSSDVKKGGVKPPQTQPTKNVNSQVGKVISVPPSSQIVTAKGGKKAEESSSSSSSSSDVKIQKGNEAGKNLVKGQTKGTTANVNKVGATKPNPKVVPVAENSDSDSSSSDEKVAQSKKATTTTPTTTGKTNAPKKGGSDDSSDSSSEMHIDLNKPKTVNDIKMGNTDEKGTKRKRENDESNFAKKRKMNNGESDGTGTKVRLGNLSFELDGQDEEIRKQFESCGEIKGIEMIKRNDQRFAGVAILEFVDQDSAQNAVNMNNQEFYGRKMALSFATESQSQKGGGAGGKRQYQVSPKPEGCTTIFIGNLNFNITEDQVFEFFADCGDIKECRWPRGDFTGIGWVEFYDTNATDLAVKKTGQNVMGRDIRVDYAAPRRNKEF